MPVFEFTALDARGKTTSGIIDADGIQAARQKARASGKFPVSIREAQEAQARKSRREIGLGAWFSRVKPADVAMTTRQLATLIGAGFPLVSALDALLPQTHAYGLKRTLARVKDLVVEGNSFAHALAQFPGIFPPIYVNMVRAGETSGTLEIVLERLADITEKQQALSNRIQAALAYPVFMLFFGAVVLFQLITLPVEFNASARAKAVLAESGIVSNREEAEGVSRVLNAAGWTYVAAALAAVMQLLYFLLLVSGRSRD